MNERAATFEFHVSRAARRRYQFDEAWFSLTGNVLLADMAATRRLAYRMNQVRDAGNHPERAVHAGQLHAMGLIDEILHYVAGLYRGQIKADALDRALDRLDARFGRATVDQTLARFAEEFPPLAVHRGEIDVEGYLRGVTAGVRHRVILLEELLLLWLGNVNPAFAPFKELFDDVPMVESAYASIVRELAAFFATQPPFGPDQQCLPDMLRAPALASPHSLWGQLDYIRSKWGYLLGEFLDRLLVTIDVIREEERGLFLRFAAWSDTQHSAVSDLRALESEPERFSQDRDWMPRVVLMAKSTYVWLDQLARRYQRPVSRLDQIPEEELDRLARWGVTALWLIGLWERSPASQEIKRRCGNPEALASAYSLHDYRIAADLGGEDGYAKLKERAARRGIRLASDMVPNHMGIDSRWMVEHPNWFLSLDHSPYPSYTFHGSDLSSDDRVALRIEDHYYDRTDAAVVFQRIDRRSGETRYVYHGNDGTFMPWNDTAQLDFLKAEVREGVIQTILHVARQFPIIRFDAAMTLAKRHFSRLWYPEPGSGGAIPSRAERGLTKADFDAAFPVEFWREVVDRVAAELPDTLLLAEAFWLMEGYFVRTLGMHRVYNSAFMNMLRDEENANYRSVIKNTLEFDPEILKRYVNFMNNPDERTAVDQFGKGDKYFGVCTLMATLPGLPMFGHGQVEGFTERYGMEFRRASWDETPDPWLIERHEREIFPLLHRRRVFAEARDFLLYDFYTNEGTVNEDVFAYSNRDGGDRALVLYHNRYADTAGWIRVSAARLESRGGKRMAQRTVGEGLGLSASGDRYCVFRDHVSGLEFVRSSLELCERGLYAELPAYRCQVFVDFREVQSDAEHPWAEVARDLGGRGTPDAERMMRGIKLKAVIEPFRKVVDPARIARALAGAPGDETDNGSSDDAAQARAELVSAARELELAVRPHVGAGDGDAATARFRERLDAIVALESPVPRDARAIEGIEATGGGRRGWGTSTVEHGNGDDAWEQGAGGHGDVQGVERRARAVLLAWGLVEPIGAVLGERDAASRSRAWLREWSWDRMLIETLERLGDATWRAVRAVDQIEALIGHLPAFRAAAEDEGGLPDLLEAWLADSTVRRALDLNEYEGEWWIRKESFEELLGYLLTAAEVERERGSAEERGSSAADERRLADRLLESAESAGWRLAGFVEHARG
jgi:glycosidase